MAEEQTSITERWRDDGRYTPAVTPSNKGPSDVVRHSHAGGRIHAHVGGILDHAHG